MAATSSSAGCRSRPEGAAGVGATAVRRPTAASARKILPRVRRAVTHGLDVGRFVKVLVRWFWSIHASGRGGALAGGSDAAPLVTGCPAQFDDTLLHVRLPVMLNFILAI